MPQYMRLTTGSGASATAVAAGSTITMPTTTPVIVGRQCLVEFYSKGVTGTPTVLVEGSSDGTTWTTLATAQSNQMVTNDYWRFPSVQVYKYMRYNTTVAGGAGVFNIYVSPVAP